MAATDSGRKTSAWLVVTTVATLLIMVGVGLGVALLMRQAQSQELRHAKTIDTLEALLAELRAQRIATWTMADKVQHNCHATNAEATCTFTNLQDSPVSTCAFGVLAQKGGDAKIQSIALCTGSLQPFTTRTVSAPWVGAFAKDLCSSQRYGTDVLDWEKCEFDTVPMKVQ